MDIVSANEMKLFDKKTIDNGTSSITLMKRASNFMLENIDKTLKTLILVGSGNNGGDGLSLAEDLYKVNKNITVLLVKEPKTEEAKYYLERIKKDGIKIENYTNINQLDSYEMYVDCILGVGLTRDVEGEISDIITYINSLKKIVVCCDIPSGLNANNGRTKLAFVATKTITFGAIKLGHLLGAGKDYVGELLVSDIGISCIDSKCKIYQKEDFKCHFEPLKQDLHKYTNGRVVLIGGSKKYIGAPILSSLSLGAIRVGAGLSTVAFPSFLYDEFASRALVETLFPLSSNDEGIVFKKEEFDELINKAKAVSIGMGIGRSEEVKNILEYLLSKDISLLIDADALYVLGTNLDLLLHKKARVVLTPHIGEFSRLTSLDANDILNDPVNIAIDFAKKYDVTVLLKGATSIITDGVRVAISPYGNSCLSKGGSGDILSGIILGLLTKNDLFYSSTIGAYILGRCGDILEKELTCYSVASVDIPNVIPKVIKEIMESEPRFV